MHHKFVCLFLPLLIFTFVSGKPQKSSTREAICKVKEKRSGDQKHCQFPFIYKNVTYFGCTTVDGYPEGTPWCSTKVYPNTLEHDIYPMSNHYYGDCNENVEACFKQDYQFWLDYCTKNDEMPFFNETLNDYTCYPILSNFGQCEPNYWFVLDENQPNRAVCAKQPCNDNLQELEYEEKYSEYEDFSYKILFDGECISNLDTTVCPYGQELSTDPFGKGR